jgi:hypothetical protein
MIFGITWEGIFQIVSQILTAGVAITAFSLLLFAFVYNLREGVVKAFILIMICVLFIYTGEAIAGASDQWSFVETMLRMKWAGIILLPATYLHFANALLSLTGLPSRGRRIWAVRLAYVFSIIALVLIPLNIIVGPYLETSLPASQLARTQYTNLVALYYIIVMVVAGSIIFRAFQRTVTKTSRRRMIYLMTGATASAIGIFSFLLYDSGIFLKFPIIYWILVSISALSVGAFLVILAYVVAFFGVTWPDRVVKSRLFKWFMRGPFTASIVLGGMTIIRRIGLNWGNPYNAFVPIFMVVMTLLMEYSITLLAPIWERLLFYGSDRDDVTRIQSLEDHLLTRSDLSQFLEIVTATICDLLQVDGAFVAMMDGAGLEMLTTAGDDSAFRKIESSDELLEISLNDKISDNGDFFWWHGHLIVPLVFKDPQNGKLLLGLCGFPWEADAEMDEEHLDVLKLLTYRTGIALKNWRIQQQVIQSMENLQPQVALIQQLRAASSYNKTSVLLDEADLPEEDFVTWVKDALSHYWGGPKLSESPLLNLNIVQSAIKEYDGNPTNALRGILKSAIEQIKPEGDRRFTGEWLLYNILELKFIEGKKVREVASRLAMSEADLYRKQKIALEAISKAILNMELAEREEEGS